MIITNHREKLVNAVIYFAKNTKLCGKTKLMKLLFSLDFSHFKQTGKSVTGLEYFAWEWGPVPKELFEEISGEMKPDLKSAINIVPIDNFQKIVPKKKFDPKYFTKREMRVLENIADVFKETNADQTVEVSHLKNEPWQKTLREKGSFEKIDYMLSIDDTGNSLSKDDAQERMGEIAEMHRLFGTA